jgi:hypothetical protein
MCVYTVTRANLEMPQGTRFSVRRCPIQDGQLCLVRINNLLILGRYFAGVGGSSWIIQPGRWILADELQIIGRIEE